MDGVFIIYFSGGREDGHCSVGAKDVEQAKRIFRIRVGDEWNIDRILTHQEYVAEIRAVDPDYTGLKPGEIPEYQKALILELGT